MCEDLQYHFAARVAYIIMGRILVPFYLLFFLFQKGVYVATFQYSSVAMPSETRKVLIKNIFCSCISSFLGKSVFF